MTADRFAGLPRVIRVCGHRVTVEIGTDKLPPDQAGGYIEHEQRIDVDAALGPDAARETVWHELTHCAEIAAGLDLQEHEIHAIARIQYQIMRDNPALVAWICGQQNN